MTEELDDFEDLFEDLQEETIEEIDEDFLPPDSIIEKDEEEDGVIIDAPPSGEDEDDDDDDDEDPKKTGDEEEEVNYFNEVAKGLSKLGKFEDIPEGEDLTEEKFLEYFDNFTKKKAMAEIEDLLTDKWGDEGLDMFNDIFVKKVPLKTYLELKTASEDINNMDVEDVINQKHIVRTYLEKTGIDEEEIEEQLEILESNDKLKVRAEKYKEKLVEDAERKTKLLADESEIRQKELKKQDEARRNSLRETIEESVKKGEINGIPLSVKDRTELLPYITAPAYKLANGNTITEFDKAFFDLKKDPVKMIALAKLIKEDLNIGSIENKVIEKKEEEIFKFKNKPKSKDVESALDLLFGKTKKK
jgi:hypothetical protein